MKLLRQPGSTSHIFQIFIEDSSKTDGSGLTGLTSASAGLTAYFHRNTDTTATAIILVSMTSGTFTSGGFIEVDSSHLPGVYQFCPPNTALAAGATSTVIFLNGATNMAPMPIEIDLNGQVNLQSTGLDSVSTTQPTTVPTTFTQVLMWLYMRFANKCIGDANLSTIIVKAADNTTTVTTQTATNTGGIQTQGKVT